MHWPVEPWVWDAARNSASATPSAQHRLMISFDGIVLRKSLKNVCVSNVKKSPASDSEHPIVVIRLSAAAFALDTLLLLPLELLSTSTAKLVRCQEEHRAMLLDKLSSRKPDEDHVEVVSS